jgi:hypothetical protein
MRRFVDFEALGGVANHSAPARRNRTLRHHAPPEAFPVGV